MYAIIIYYYHYAHTYVIMYMYKGQYKYKNNNIIATLHYTQHLILPISSVDTAPGRGDVLLQPMSMSVSVSESTMHALLWCRQLPAASRGPATDSCASGNGAYFSVVGEAL
jgi:hypothetical protein